MATTKMELELDAAPAQGVHDWAAARGARADDVIADALASFLGAKAVSEAHAVGGLPQKEADRLAVEEVRAYRAARVTFGRSARRSAALSAAAARYRCRPPL